MDQKCRAVSLASLASQEAVRADTPGRILVVDDESSMRRVLRLTLAALGFSVGEEPNRERAIERLRAEPFDAVLLDSNMPGMGGVATCRMLRRQYPVLGILMLTVRDRPEDRIELLRLRSNLQSSTREHSAALIQAPIPLSVPGFEALRFEPPVSPAG
jgi:CheY-like chemotaxis protein